MQPMRKCMIKKKVGAYLVMSYLRTLMKGYIQGWKYYSQSHLKKQMETVWFPQKRFRSPLIPLSRDPVCRAQTVELFVQDGPACRTSVLRPHPRGQASLAWFRQACPGVGWHFLRKDGLLPVLVRRVPRKSVCLRFQNAVWSVKGQGKCGKVVLRSHEFHHD